MTDPSPGLRPAFTDVWLPEATRGIALVLHGGAQRTTQPADGRSLSWRRARALARDIAPALGDAGIGCVLLRYRVKGWNAESGHLPDPVIDARWALDEIAAEHNLPVALLGHSMGARTGVAVADHPSVRGVVALAPWFQSDDAVTPLANKVLRAAHGRRDKITSARATQEFVARATRICDATYTDMGPIGHYLLRRVGAWNDFAMTNVQEVFDHSAH